MDLAPLTYRDMELTLIQEIGGEVLVKYNGVESHRFSLKELRDVRSGFLDFRGNQAEKSPRNYGAAIYNALFRRNQPTWQALSHNPDRILLVTEDEAIQEIEWEYALAPSGYLALDHHFVRGLPEERRVPPPRLESPLHIIAVPSDPLDLSAPRLDVTNEWAQLSEVIRGISGDITLERVFPPTIEKLRAMVGSRHSLILHFMGHVEQEEHGAELIFEKRDGSLDQIPADQFIQRVRRNVLLVTLNACVSATPGRALFSNLAAALAQARVPYALGMRFSISDDDARKFSRSFYSELSLGVPVEEALHQARLTLSGGRREFLVGIPVLYTSLTEPAAGFKVSAGKPLITSQGPLIDLNALGSNGTRLVGRTHNLLMLGRDLAQADSSSDDHQLLLTIQGAKGVGKRSLAREAALRFSHAWRGGVLAISLDPPPAVEELLSKLANFLRVNATADEIKRQVKERAEQEALLLILDGAQTLIDEDGGEEAQKLVRLLREFSQTPGIGILAISTRQLGWSGERVHQLKGLDQNSGAELFKRYAANRASEIALDQAERLSRRAGGYPELLKLLGERFSNSSVPIEPFIEQIEAILINDQSFKDSIAANLRGLDEGLIDALGKLWIFKSPFPPETAAAVLNEAQAQLESEADIEEILQELWRRGLLMRADGAPGSRLRLYEMEVPMRIYVEHFVSEKERGQEILSRFARACFDLAGRLYQRLDYSREEVFIANQIIEDLNRARDLVAEERRGDYLLYLGCILNRVGDVRQAVHWLETALEIAEQRNRQSELNVLLHLAQVHGEKNHVSEYLKLSQRASRLAREIGDRSAEAAALNWLADAYLKTRQPQQAFRLHEEALQLSRQTGGRAHKAFAINGLGNIHLSFRDFKKAESCYQQAQTILEGVGHKIWQSGALGNLADVHNRLGNSKQAFGYFQRSLDIVKEMGVRDRIVIVQNSVAWAHLFFRDSQDSLEKAYELFRKNRLLAHEIGNRAIEVASLNGLAQFYLLTDHPGRAEESYEKALELIRGANDEEGTKTNNTATEGYIRYYQAQMYQALGNFPSAEEMFKKAAELAERSNDVENRVNSLSGLANLYLMAGNPTEALNLFQQIKEIAQTFGQQMAPATHIASDGSGLSHSPAQSLLELTSAGALVSSGSSGAGPSAMTGSSLGVGQATALQLEISGMAWEVAALQGIALVYHAQGRFKDAFNQFDIAIARAEQVGTKYDQAAALVRKARVCHSSGRPRESLDLLAQVLQLANEHGHWLMKIEALSLMAWPLYSMGGPKEAIERLEEALREARSADHAGWEAALLYNQGEIYQLNLQPSEAIDKYLSSSSVAFRSRHKVGEAFAHTGLGMTYQASLRSRQAIAEFEKAIALRKELGDLANAAMNHSLLAGAHHSLGNLKEARNNYQRALDLSRQTTNRFAEGQALQAMAQFHQLLGQSQEALALYDQMQELANRNENEGWKAAILQGKGIFHQAHGNPHLALDLFRQALQSFKQTGNLFQETGTIRSIAQTLHALGQFNEAIEQYEKSSAMARQSGNRIWESLAEIGKADAYLAMGWPQQALNIYHQTLDRVSQQEDFSRAIFTRNSIALLHRTCGRIEQALDQYGQLSKLAQQVGDYAWHATALLQMAQLYQSIGQLQEAYDKHSDLLKLGDETGDYFWKSSAANNLAYWHLIPLGQYQKAIQSYEQAISLARESRNQQGESIAANLLSQLYHCIGQLKFASDYNQKSIELYVNNSDLSNHLVATNSKAQTHQNLGEYDLASNCYEEALRLTHEIKSASREVFARNAIASFRLNQTGQPEIALDYFLQASQKAETGDISAQINSLMGLAQAHQALGRIEEATDFFSRSLRLARETRNRSFQVSTLDLIAKLRLSLAQYDEALQAITEAENIYRDSELHAWSAAILNRHAELHQATRRWGHAIDAQEKALAVAQKIGDWNAEMSAIAGLSQNYRMINQPDSVDRLWQTAAGKHERRGDLARTIIILNAAAWSYQIMAKHESAMKALQNSLRIAQQIGDKRQEVNILALMGASAYAMNNPYDALSHYTQANAISRDMGSRHNEINSLWHLAKFHFSRNAADQAFRYFEQALALARKDEITSWEPVILSEIGLCRKLQAAHPLSPQFLQMTVQRFEEALSTAQRRKLLYQEKAAFNYLSQTYREMGATNEACVVYERALERARALNDRMWQADSLNWSAETYRLGHDFESTIKNYRAALEISRQIGNRRSEGLAYNGLGLATLASKRPEEASNYFEQYRRLCDATFDDGGKATALYHLSLPPRQMNRKADAINHLQQAISILEQLNMPTTYGGTPLQQMRQELEQLRLG
jgi:tetratricopeptide (TPR) repeat protein